jgi:hypothetical protein
VLDEMGQIGAVPWTYRPWLILLSKTYRAEMRSLWTRKGALYQTVDIILSAAFMLFELLLLAALLIRFTSR